MTLFIAFVIPFLIFGCLLAVTLHYIFKTQDKCTSLQHDLKVTAWFVLMIVGIYVCYDIATTIKTFK